MPVGSLFSSKNAWNLQFYQLIKRKMSMGLFAMLQEEKFEF